LEPFHIRIRKLREARNLSIRQVAKEVGVPASTYRDWEYNPVRSSILLLDDETTFTQELSRSLSDQFSVSVTNNPSDAMGLISKLHPHLIVKYLENWH